MLRIWPKIVVALFVLIVALPAIGAQEKKKGEPLTESEIVSLLQAGVAARHVEELAHERGVTFEVTAAVERDLRDAGAPDSLLGVLRQVALKPAAPAYPQASAVVLLIESTPGGAQVLVDDELIARTSSEGRLKISTLAAGHHRLRLALDGYRDFEQTIELTPGSNTVIATLQAAPAPSPQAPPPAPSPPHPASSKSGPKAYFGVLVQSLTADSAKTLKVPDTSGALVQQVVPQGPAAEAGLKQGDVVRTFNGNPVKTSEDLVTWVGEQDPGTEVALEILRKGSPLTLTVKLAAPPLDFNRSIQIIQGPLRGLTFVELTDIWRNALAIPPKIGGVVVSDIAPGTPAAQAGLAKGDVLEEVNRKKVKSLGEISTAAGETSKDVLLLVYRGGQAMYIVLSANP